MASDDLFQAFIEKIKREKTPEEAAKYFAEVLKVSSASLYFVIMGNLDNQDIEEISELPEKDAEKEIIKRFKKKTGMNPKDFVLKLRDKISSDYLFPELKTGSD